MKTGIFRKEPGSWAWGHTSVFLAEIGRTAVQSQPRQKIREDPPHLN
jgi:hypothetical protein